MSSQNNHDQCMPIIAELPIPRFWEYCTGTLYREISVAMLPAIGNTVYEGSRVVVRVFCEAVKR